ncbi:bacillithiol biosynthesis cysteine-adding enzyme BshC [Bacillus tianshenii]|nr:bacillithiol biosynthesis cysteine-adding enzyme BshC [Bacillus tianshenii]
MEIRECSLPSTNPFVADYLNRADKALKYFDYHPGDEEAVARRAEELRSRTFKRSELASYLHEHHQQFDCSEKTFENIRKFDDERAVAVVAGQQAGVLTGPLYTIHKAVSVIQFAKEQEEKLGIPVVPVFWSAGEDHDFAEINHVYAPVDKRRVRKFTVEEDDGIKLPVSERKLNRKQTIQWVKEVLAHFPETIHTRELLQKLESLIEVSKTYTDFFNRFLLTLFAQQGLVVMDSNDPKLRQLEADFFMQLITENRPMQRNLLQKQLMLAEDNYGEPIAINEHNANLFYHNDQGERILLERLESGEFVGKNRTLRFTEDELLDVAKETPEKLSNNVVTRPLMQDYVLPVLAFFGGPGEISYWAVLKDVFAQFDFKMPPVLPRLNITLVERRIETWLEELELSFDNVLQNGTNAYKEQRLANYERKEIDEKMKEAAKEIDDIHQRLRMLASEVDGNLTHLAYQNGGRIQMELQYLHKQIDRSLRVKEGPMLVRYDAIDCALSPSGSPQERVWNILYFLNQYGLDFVNQLSEIPYSFNNRHKVILI